MTIQDFDQALKEQESEIQQAYGKLQQVDIRQALDDAAPAGWNQWGP